MKQKVAVGVVLFLSGIVLLFYSISSQVYGYIGEHSRRTSDNIKGIDRNISKELNLYRETLEFIAEHIAHEEEKPLSNDKMIDDLLIVEQNQIIFSEEGKFDYSFEKIEGFSDLSWSLDDNGEYNLAITYISNVQDTREYILLLDLEEFYKTVASEKNQPHDGVILVDVSGKVVMNSRMDEVFIENAEQTQETSVKKVLEVHEEGEEKLLHYEQFDPRSGKDETKYIRALPVQGTENRLFTISVRVLIGNSIQNIRQMTMIALGSGVFMAVGIILATNAAIKDWKKSKREKEELQEMAHRQRLETIGILTSGVAHEFGNLLTPIMGYSILALEKIPEENTEASDNLVEIYNAAYKAKELIGRLSDLSRKKDSKVYTLVSIDDTIMKTVQMAKAAQPKNMQVITELNGKEKSVWGNETLLMQMLLNLILNAFHAVDREVPGKVVLSTNIQEQQICIQVHDDGAGIPEAVRSKIFEPFFTTKQDMKGTGLGLVIVQQIIEAHDGKIRVESEEGKWTTFTILLPVRE